MPLPLSSFPVSIHFPSLHRSTRPSSPTSFSNTLLISIAFKFRSILHPNLFNCPSLFLHHGLLGKHTHSCLPFLTYTLPCAARSSLHQFFLDHIIFLTIHTHLISLDRFSSNIFLSKDRFRDGATNHIGGAAGNCTKLAG